MNKTFSEWLVANGYDESQISEATKKHLKLAYDAERPADPAPESKPVVKDKNFDETMAAIHAENERIAYIRQRTLEVAPKYIGDPDKVSQLNEMCEAAISDKSCGKQAFDLQLARHDRFSGITVFAPKKEAITEDVVEAAVYMSLGGSSPEKHYSEKHLETASKKFKRGMQLSQLTGLVAEQNGYRGDRYGTSRVELWQAAVSPRHSDRMELMNGPSTISVSGILSNVANKRLVDHFTYVEQDWRPIAAIRSVNDFKTHTSYSLTGDLKYKKLPPGGEIEHGKLSEESYTISIDTYAKRLSIDRRDIINDDLGAFDSVLKKLGRGGALALNQVVWTEFLADHTTFFPTDASLGNYEAGSDDSLLDLVGLKTANTLFELQTDPDGNPAGITPAIVLVPPQLYPQAWTLLMSSDLNLATSTSASTGTRSPWTGMFKLVKSKYLAMSSMGGGYSAKVWYMLADPNDVPVIEVAFLNGQETPTVSSGEAERGLGMTWQAFHDFGSNKQEYRAAVKMKGEA